MARKSTLAESEVAEKWGLSVADRGFSQIPNYLMLINQFLDEDKSLSPLELLLLLQLASAWWKRDEAPFPSVKTLANRCGTSDRQIQRALARLEKDGFLQRQKRREQGVIASNAYNLMPLVEILEEIAKLYPNKFKRS